jgi:hypothetical protein
MTSVVDVTTNRHVRNMLSWLHFRHVREVDAAEKKTSLPYSGARKISGVKYLPFFLI